MVENKSFFTVELGNFYDFKLQIIQLCRICNKITISFQPTYIEISNETIYIRMDSLNTVHGEYIRPITLEAIELQKIFKKIPKTSTCSFFFFEDYFEIQNKFNDNKMQKTKLNLRYNDVSNLPSHFDSMIAVGNVSSLMHTLNSIKSFGGICRLVFSQDKINIHGKSHYASFTSRFEINTLMNMGQIEKDIHLPSWMCIHRLLPSTDGSFEVFYSNNILYFKYLVNEYILIHVIN